MPTLGLLLLAATPVLLDPAGAAADLHDPRIPPAQGAELALLLGQASPGRDFVERLPVGPRRTRLELDLSVLAEDRGAAERAYRALLQAPGWSTHAAVQAARLEERRWAARAREFGLWVFALALAGLALGGARELLRPSFETLLGAAGLLVALGVGRQVPPPIGELLGLYGAVLWALIHAAAAARRRVDPSGRGRAILITLVLLGFGGVLVATLAGVGLSEVLAQAMAGPG